jgi:predicted transcriptional regulator
VSPLVYRHRGGEGDHDSCARGDEPHAAIVRNRLSPSDLGVSGATGAACASVREHTLNTSTPRCVRVRCSAICATLAAMSPTPPPLSLRLGDEGLRALDELARRRHVTRAEAARQAISETAARERRRAGLAAEAAALMRDPDYLAEAREVAALMEQLRGSR